MANLNFIQDTVKRVDEQKKKERRYKMAMYFLRNYDKGSEWLIKENLKLLYFYKDFDFVLEAVKNLQEKVKSDYLSKYIEQFLDGTLDVDDIIKSQVFLLLFFLKFFTHTNNFINVIPDNI